MPLHELNYRALQHLPTGWQAEADAMDEAQLRNEIVQAEDNLRTIDTDERENKELQELKAKARDASAGYRDGRKAQRAKIAYALYLLAQKGKI